MSFLAALFGGAPKTKMPAVPPPPAVPRSDVGAEDVAAKAANQRAGLSKTLLTGDLAPVSTGRKTLLGG